MDKYTNYMKRNSSNIINGNNSSPIWRNSLSSTTSTLSSSSNSVKYNFINSSKSVPNISNLNLSDTENTDDDDGDDDDEHYQAKPKRTDLSKSSEDEHGKKTDIALLNGGNNDHRNLNKSNVNDKKNPLYSSNENVGQQHQRRSKNDDNDVDDAEDNGNSSELMRMMMLLRKKRQQQQKQLQQQLQQDYINSETLFSKETDKQQQQRHNQQGQPAIDDQSESVTHLTKNSATMRGNLSAKPPISKKRQELTKAITEARKKLETIGWKASGLNTSKSVANLRDIGDIRDQVNMGTPTNTSFDSVRRSISLSDLSVNPAHRRILSNRNDVASNRLSLIDKDKESAPLWNRVKIEKPINKLPPSHHHHQMNPIRKSFSTVTLNRNCNDINSSSSSSSAAVNAAAASTQQANQSSVSRILQRSLWGPPVNLNTLTHSKSWGRLSAPPTKGYISSTPVSRNSNRRPNDNESDDSSSSNEERLPVARPGTPPKPKPLTRNRRIASNQTSKDNFLAINNSTISNSGAANSRLLNGNQDKKPRKTWSNNFVMQGAKSDFNLSNVGRETPNQVRSPSSNSSHFGHTDNYYEKFDIASANPVKIALTEDLCSTIIDELNQVATFVKKIYHRSAAEGRTNLCNILVDGISKAYVSLSTVVAPSEMSANTISNSMSPNSTTVSSPSSTNPENLTQTLKLLQQYSDRLLDIVEQRMSSKSNKKE